jgi:hypothetical protein
MDMMLSSKNPASGERREEEETPGGPGRKNNV